MEPIGYDNSHSNKIKWSIVSKAFFQSKNTTHELELWGAQVDINANWKKSFLICNFTFSTKDFCSNITNFMVTW